jgi:hypothetical protein
LLWTVRSQPGQELGLLGAHDAFDVLGVGVEVGVLPQVVGKREEKTQHPVEPTDATRDRPTPAIITAHAATFEVRFEPPRSACPAASAPRSKPLAVLAFLSRPGESPTTMPLVNRHGHEAENIGG